MALEKFHYETKAGDKIVLPKFDTIPTGILRRTRNMNGQDQMFAVLETLLGDDSKEMAAIDLIPSGELKGFIADWQKDAGIDMGESSAS